MVTDVLDDAELSEEPRTQLYDRVATKLAELSQASDAPEGVEACAPFSEDEVSFDSGAWMDRLAEVQGWLHFAEDLSTANAASFLRGLTAALGFETQEEAITPGEGAAQLTEEALERLAERVELAARLQDTFLAELNAEGGSPSAAGAAWAESRSTEEDGAEVAAPEPVKARAATWNISDLLGNDLNLAPSYQRGDVWRTSDRQALVESILRGIPLPSIIMLNTGPATPYEVVDGKQRLTAILRFVGRHPVALAKVAEADALHPEAGLKKHFDADYPRFRTAWKRYMGESLTAKLEDEYYFPFKLRSDPKGGLQGAYLVPLRGAYYTDIRDNVVNVAGQEVTVKTLFERKPVYAVPVIEYLEATQRQIHEVFKLYNKQGMHLNAEEIRNAVYHDIELTKAILVAAGDASASAAVADIAPALAGVAGIRELGKTLADYGFGEARYRRTKVLGWVLAVLLNDTGDKPNGAGKKLLPSTARHTDDLLSQVQEDKDHPLRDEEKIADLFGLIAQAADLHAGHNELWPDSFRGNGKSSKWQDLQLVGSLVGIAIAIAGASDDIESRIEASAGAIRKAAEEDWTRPGKTQTRTQWDYIAKIARGVVRKLDIDITDASNAIRARFGSSGVESLLGSIIPEKST